MSPDRTLAKARDMAAARRGDGGDGSGAGGAAGPSFGGPDVTTPAAADFPTVGATSKSSVAPGQVAINWARIDGPDDIKLAMQQLADARAGEIDVARRGVRSHAETAAEAGRTDAWSVLMERRATGQAAPLNAEQSLAAR